MQFYVKIELHCASFESRFALNLSEIPLTKFMFRVIYFLFHGDFGVPKHKT